MYNIIIMTDVVLPQEVNFNTASTEKAHYRYLNVNPYNTGSNNIALSTSTQLVQFRIPAMTVFRPSQIMLGFIAQFPAAAANNIAVMYNDCASVIRRIEFGPSSGGSNLLLSMDNANRASKLLSRLKPWSEIETRNSLSFCHPFNTGSTLNPLNALSYGCNELVINNTLGVNYASLGVTVDVPSTKLSDVQHLLETDTAAAGNRTIKFKLGDLFPCTFFEIDHDVCFSIDMYLNIYVSTLNECGFSCLTASLTAGTILQSATGPSVAPTALASLTLASMQLNVPVQQNPILAQGTQQAMVNGQILYVDYPVVNVVSTAASTSQAVNLQYNRGYGQKLKYILHTCFDASVGPGTLIAGTTAASNISYLDNNNIEGAKVELYNTYLNSIQLQDRAIISAAGAGQSDGYDDSQYVLDLQLNNNHGYPNVISYYANWMHVENFSQARLDCVGGEALSKVISGLDMSEASNNNLNYQWIGTTANLALTHFVIAIFTKSFMNSPQGVQEMAVLTPSPQAQSVY